MLKFVLVSSCILAGLCTGAPFENPRITATSQRLPTVPEVGVSVSRSGGLVIGDIELDLHRNAVARKDSRWPGGIVFYTISNGYSSAIKTTIREAMNEIETDVNGPTNKCIEFRPRTTQANYVDIVSGKGCHSLVGYVGAGGQEMSLGPGCEQKGIIMHELLHAIGFFHEQNRYDRDSYVTVDLSNVPTEQQSDFYKMDSRTLDTLNTSYSYDSIMHYGPYSLASDKSRPVLTPKPGKYSGPMGQRKQLTPLDVLKIQRLYGCPEDVTHIVTEENDVFTECNFEKGLCSMTPVAGDLDWEVTKDGSDAGPAAGHTNGIDGYLLARATGQRDQVARFNSPASSEGHVCLAFSLFQRGPSSYLDLVAFGPRILPQTISTYKGQYRNEWVNFWVSLAVPDGLEFQVTFEAHLNQGDVAIDDLSITFGPC